MTAKKKSASPPNPQADALVERIYKEIQDRKGKLAEDVSQKRDESAALNNATAALDRIRTKEKTVRKWPKILRSVRRNQQTVNDCLLNAMENVIAEVSQLRRMQQGQAAQSRGTLNRSEAVVNKRISPLEGRMDDLDATLQRIETRLQCSGELSPELKKGEGDGATAPAPLGDAMQDIQGLR